jgi:hypothetical protein
MAINALATQAIEYLTLRLHKDFIASQTVSNARPECLVRSNLCPFHDNLEKAYQNLAEQEVNALLFNTSS